MKEIIDCRLPEKLISILFIDSCIIITLTKLITEFIYSFIVQYFLLYLNLQLKATLLC